MKTGFLIASLTSDGGYNGYFDGNNFENQDLDSANIISDKTQARAALGNLQRVNADKDLTIVPVEIKITIASSVTQVQ